MTLYWPLVGVEWMKALGDDQAAPVLEASLGAGRFGILGSYHYSYLNHYCPRNNTCLCIVAERKYDIN